MPVDPINFQSINITIMRTTVIDMKSLLFNPKVAERLTFGISLACLFLFIISAYAKIEGHDKFILGLSKVQFIGSYALWVSWAVPVSEIAISILLIHPLTQRYGLLGFTGLMMVFTLYILGMLLWAEKLPCHCNLIIEKLSFSQHLIFNVAFIALALLALRLMKIKKIIIFKLL